MPNYTNVFTRFAALVKEMLQV